MRKDAAGPDRPRKRYRTRNWREYDRGLIARGDLTVWLSPDLAWHAPEGTGKRGRPRIFSDTAIQCVLTLKVLFHLPLRAAQGLVGSLLRLARLDWPVPHYSTLSRRQRDLTVVIPCRPRGEPLHLVVDSTGVKVLGEGEWKVRRHGADRRRVWRKVHLAIDAESVNGGRISGQWGGASVGHDAPWPQDQPGSASGLGGTAEVPGGTLAAGIRTATPAGRRPFDWRSL